MKIIRLTANNFKRLTAVEITPDGNTIVISGRNGAGKTSVLDAIWAVLSNPGVKQFPKPIRKGEKKAEITLKLDEENITVKRVFTESGTKLEITNDDGLTFKRPQELLDGLLGKLTFDPLEFKEMSEQEQTQLLLSLVDLEIDLDQVNKERQGLYNERTVVNRLVAAAKAKINGEVEKVDRVSVFELTEELQKASDENTHINVTKSNIESWERKVSEKNHAIQLLKKQYAEIMSEIKLLENAIHDGNESLKAPKRYDIAAIQERIKESEATNRQADLYQNYMDSKRFYETQLNISEKLTDSIKNIDRKKTEAVANATFPIGGLGFGSTGVTFDGIPLKQISDAEQLKVSLAIAMAMNPTLRVIRIRNGSLLDAENLAVIEQMADDKDYQIWIERVSNDGEGVGIVIEDGMVKS